MKIESNVGTHDAVRLVSKRLQPTFAQTVQKFPASGDHVRFGNKTQEQLIKEEARRTAGMFAKTPEVLGPDLFWGSMPLGYLSTIDTRLSPAAEAKMKAYTDLIGIGLRPKKQSAAAEQAALNKLANPTSEMQAWFKELNITADTLKTPVVDAHQIDQDNDVPPDVHQRMSDLGLYRLKVPTEYGGLGLHQKEYGKVLEAFPDVSSTLGTLVSAHSTIGSAPLIMFGTPEQKEKYLRQVSTGQSLAAFGLTEPLAGTDLEKMTTSAELSADGKHWILNGEKLFITNSVDSGIMYVITGKTKVGDKVLGPSVMIVDLPFKVNEPWEEKKRKLKELGDQGMEITPFTKDVLELMMIRGSDQSFIQFKNFKVPVENVLGPREVPKGKDGLPKPGDLDGVSSLPDSLKPAIGSGKVVPLLSLNKGRAGFGPYVTEAAAWFAAATIKHTVDREMFDMYSPKAGQSGVQANMQSVRTKIGDMQIKRAQLKAVSDLISALIDANPKMGVGVLSAAIKVRATDYAWKVAQSAAELHGGHGLIKGAPNGIERNFRDAWIPMIVEGVNPAMAQLAMLLSGKPVQAALPSGIGHLGINLGYFVPKISEESIPGFLNNLIPSFFRKKAGEPDVTFWARPDKIDSSLKMTKSQLNFFEHGDLNLDDAMWIQYQTKKFSHNFGMLGLMYGDNLAKEQNLLIRCFNIFMDLITLAAVQLKLKQQDATLSKEEKIALQGAVKEIQHRVPEEMQYISVSIPGFIAHMSSFGFYKYPIPKHPLEEIQTQVGDAFIEADMKHAKAQRANTQEASVNFLREAHEKFHGGLRAEGAAQPQAAV